LCDGDCAGVGDGGLFGAVCLWTTRDERKGWGEGQGADADEESVNPGKRYDDYVFHDMDIIDEHDLMLCSIDDIISGLRCVHQIFQSLFRQWPAMLVLEVMEA
jgi:hypothetical protein